MKRKFADLRTEQIYETRFAKSVSDKVSVPGHRVLRLLVAARSLQDVGIVGQIHELSNSRYGLHVHGKWFITFEWIGTEAWELKLERC